MSEFCDVIMYSERGVSEFCDTPSDPRAESQSVELNKFFGLRAIVKWCDFIGLNIFLPLEF